MTFQEAVKLCFTKNYMNFNGRAPRSELWNFILFLVIVDVVLMVGMQMFPTFFGIIYSLFGLATILPGLSVWVRRLHDINKNGAWVLLLIFVPIIGFIFAIIWGCEKGTPGPNQYGPDPLAHS